MLQHTLRFYYFCVLENSFSCLTTESIVPSSRNHVADSSLSCCKTSMLTRLKTVLQALMTLLRINIKG
jgi:hypothetical protein